MVHVCTVHTHLERELFELLLLLVERSLQRALLIGDQLHLFVGRRRRVLGGDHDLLEPLHLLLHLEVVDRALTW